MDKLRAIQYFVRSVELRTFVAAAAAFDVTPPAVTKLVAALEAELGTRLFNRNTRYLTLTSDGETYYAHCREMLDELTATEGSFADGGGKIRGTIILGMNPIVGANCVMPRLGSFHDRFPDIHFDLRIIHRPAQVSTTGVDVMVATTAIDERDLIAKRIAHTRFIVCASKEYWAKAGVPRVPLDLRSHRTMAFRLYEGSVLDHWEFTKGEERQAVTVRPWAIAADRDWTVEAAVAGAGVVRVTDLTVQRQLRSQALVPVMQDWTSTPGPPVYVIYRKMDRRNRRIQAFVQFVTTLFAQLEAERLQPGS